MQILNPPQVRQARTYNKPATPAAARKTMAIKLMLLAPEVGPLWTLSSLEMEKSNSNGMIPLQALLAT
jgi:hypothetical protein